MAGLKSLLITSGEKRENSVMSLEDKPSYPYGLKIHLDEETVKKLGISEAPEVGKKVQLMAIGEVVSVEKQEGRGDDHSFSMSVQLQDVDLQPSSRDQEVSNTLYGGES